MGLCTTLLALTLVLLYRSFTCGDVVEHLARSTSPVRLREHTWSVHLASGGLRIISYQLNMLIVIMPDEPAGWSHRTGDAYDYPVQAAAPASWLGRVGFEFYSAAQENPRDCFQSTSSVTLPLWVPLVLFGALPVYGLRRRLGGAFNLLFPRWTIGAALRGVFLAVALIFAFLWFRSYFIRDRIEHGERYWGGRDWILESGCGHISVSHVIGSPLFWHTAPEHSSALCRQWINFDLPWERQIADWIGFSWRYSAEWPTPRSNTIHITTPYWFWTFVALAPVVLHVRRERRRRYRQANPTLCLKCSYDLRAHQPGQRCPECGTRIASRVDASAR